MPTTQRFVITAVIVLALLAAASYGVGLWSLSLEPSAAGNAGATP
jgi:hypothetical protein